ncbi:ABC transporter ATP-binding protein [Peptoniphilus stercorisuis]|uniref:ATP-binding cassette subfamily B multidrug efflux pump n=1 Tax=Peptoniphilus stercorisuis TaxID=1436965 RepID=A0ABS4KEI0_9FIRM|nr:ABC transporter ATP-binding protein [Peptoniphilus stercorisuis]MBP2026173.1 ATP-binding cassette subfamily B multidrug efflux pump [Peptoniphilus stercorisuis]
MKFVLNYLKRYKRYLFLNLISASGFLLIDLGIPTIIAMGINNNFMDQNISYILKLSLIMFLFAIGGLLLLILLAYSSNKLVSNVIRDIRNDLFEKIESLSKDNFDKFGVSRLITNTGTDAYTIMQFLIVILRIGIMAPFMFIVSVFLIFRQSRSLALITVLAIPMMVITIALINTKTKPLSERQQKGLDNINLQIRESITGLRVIRGFNREDFKASQFESSSLNYANISKKLFQTVAFISPVFTLIFTVVQSSVMYVGAIQVNDGVLEYGMLVAFIEYVFMALLSFLMLGAVLMMLPRAQVAITRIKEVMDETPDIKSKKNAIKNNTIKGYVEFKNVSFAYSNDSEKPVIKNVSFKSKPGETIAFIGSTGSGKSTIMKLIPRLVDVSEGSILIDDIDIRDYNLDHLRGNIGYVPQKSTLFSGTIKENLQFGNKNASMEDLKKAANIAQAKEFINSTPEGFERVLSEGGTNLSGGQQQRLCIARALTRNVPIYIFDDSFSALDYKTDSILRHRLKDEIKDATFFIVAQRVGTVMDADKILVIDNGEVVGIGTHRELLKSCEVYYQIASSQLTKEELER